MILMSGDTAKLGAELVSFLIEPLPTSRLNPRDTQVHDAKGQNQALRGDATPKYLFHSRYTAHGIRGLLEEGQTSRKATAERVIQSPASKLESLYSAFGGIHASIVAELPDHAAAASLKLTVVASGAIATETTILLAPPEIDESPRRSAAYRAPRR